jgi:Cu+-exporting ATPase
VPEKLGLNPNVFFSIFGSFGRRRKTPLYVAIDQKLAAIIAVADPIKESTFAAIEALHQLGFKGCHDYR